MKGMTVFTLNILEPMSLPYMYLEIQQIHLTTNVFV